VKPFDLRHHLRPGDTVVIGQATAEPPGLVRRLIDAAEDVPGLTAFCGYAVSSDWERVGAAGPQVRAYIAHAALRKVAAKGLLDVVPVNLSAVEPDIVAGRLRADVVLLQVRPLGDDGCYSLGATADYCAAAAERAREVLVEVNPNVPQTRSTRRLHASLVTGEVHSTSQLAASPARPASDVEARVAARVAELIPSGATIQLGLGALADAVARALHDRVELKVRSGFVGDWLVGLQGAGALAAGPGSAAIGMALGTRPLYDLVDRSDAMSFMTTQELVEASALRACAPFVAVNSAVEVDLTGAVNSEVVAGRYVGAVGGLVDFARAARASVGGTSVIALASTHPNGESRIVMGLNGAVTLLKSDVDVVVTEWGTADLRAATHGERAERLIELAAPEHRAGLRHAVAATTFPLHNIRS
jgi:acyl-CoA hydrolase